MDLSGCDADMQAWVEAALLQEAAGLSLVLPPGTCWEFSHRMAFTSDTSCQDLNVCCFILFFFFFNSVVTFWGAGAASSTGVSPFPWPWEVGPKTGWMPLV